MVLDQSILDLGKEAGMDEIEIHDWARQFASVYPDEGTWKRLLTEKLTQHKAKLGENQRIEEKRQRVRRLENQVKEEKHMDLEKDLDRRIADLEKRLGKE